MQQQILHLLCTAGSCQLYFSGHEHTLTPGCCMIAMASHVGSIQPSRDCQLYRLLLPAEQQAADIMSRFIQMLESGSYRQYRTVAYYAQELCVTPKYLHKISTEVSGRTPSHWIQQFTVMEIRHLLRHGKLSAKEVAGMMNFDNVSHFSRYVSEHLGVTPKNI